MKTRPIRSLQWLKLSPRQHFLITICFIALLINLVVYLNKWHGELRSTNRYARNLYLNPDEVNTYNDLLVTRNTFDIVISYYSEDIDYVAQYIRYLRNVTRLKALRPRVIVYNKNAKINNQILKLLLDADVVQYLPNLGREGATYLYHIIQYHHILANHTIFSQAGVEGITDNGLAAWYSDRLENQFNSSVGYMPLVNNNMITTYDCGLHRTGDFPRMVQIWSILEQTLCPPGGQAVAFRGQFLVSEKRVHQRSLEVYKYIYDLITANSSHWLHRDLRSLFYKSTPDNPIFGHTIERMWTVLFRCFKPDLYDRCERRECACFDAS